MYSGHKKIYCIFKTCSVLCSTKCCLFHNFIFVTSSTTPFY